MEFFAKLFFLQDSNHYLNKKRAATGTPYLSGLWEHVPTSHQSDMAHLTGSVQLLPFSCSLINKSWNLNNTKVFHLYIANHTLKCSLILFSSTKNLTFTFFFFLQNQWGRLPFERTNRFLFIWKALRSSLIWKDYGLTSQKVTSFSIWKKLRSPSIYKKSSLVIHKPKSAFWVAWK